MKFKHYYKGKELKHTYGEKCLDKTVLKLKRLTVTEYMALLDMVWDIENYYKKNK
jgi:hypothetical protein